ncbi:hypothetical protein CPB86DRAFT_504497 [Serendipita vermifera]|nr:hypothetical protein CPB86DRAFT_504497 [Serendipita vermifera]
MFLESRFPDCDLSFPPPAASTDGALVVGSQPAMDSHIGDAVPARKGKYMCMWPFCAKTFNRRRDADTCLHKHGAIDPFSCGGGCGDPDCTMTSDYRQAVIRHQKSKGRLSCDLCHAELSSRSLKKHSERSCPGRNQQVEE